MNIRYVLIAVGLILVLGGGGYFAWTMFAGEKVEPIVEAPVPQVPADNTFSSSTLGISIKYPREYTLNSSYAYDAFGAQKLIQGVKFLIPAAVATGTNLVGADTGVSVEWLPNARSCTGDIYLKANVKAQKVSEDLTEYSLATSSTTSPGGTVEEMVYALMGSKPCTAVRYSIHTTSSASTTAEIRPYDREALLAQFEKIRLSLVVSR